MPEEQIADADDARHALAPRSRWQRAPWPAASSCSALGAAWWADLFRTGEAATRNSITGYCMDCHNAADQSGGLVLGPAMLDDIGARTEIWEKVARKIADRAMPPLDQPRPDESGYRAIQNYLETELDAHAAARPNAGELPQFHRLTRTEYSNAIRDLLALENLPAELDFELLLPADNSSSGFDNLSDLLSISPSVMERYVDAATKVSRIAVGDMTTAPLVNHHRMPLDQPQDMHVPGLPIGTRGGLLVESYFPLDAEYEITIEFATAPRGVHEIEVLLNGAPIARAEVGPATGGAALPAPVELRVQAEAGPAEIGVTFIERTQAADESILRVRRRSRGTLPDIELVTIAGPFNPAGARVHAEPGTHFFLSPRTGRRPGRSRLRNRDPDHTRQARLPAARDRNRCRRSDAVLPGGARARRL